MNKLSLALALATALVTARTASATTYNDYQIQGVSCFSATAGKTPAYSQYGVNSSTTAMDVSCPIILPGHNYSYGYIQLDGYNRSSVDKISCSIVGTQGDGNNPVVGTAYLSANSPSFQASSVSIYPNTSLFNNVMYLYCHLPAPTAQGYSHLTSIFLTTGY